MTSLLLARAPLKWAGSKRHLAPSLIRLHREVGSPPLVETCVGGLNVALALRPQQAFLGDTNPHLVNLYRHLQRGLPRTLKMYNDEVFYYAQRERFNELALCGEHWTAEAAELFYYLNRTCFNGLCRFNDAGEFNVPFGKYKSITYRADFAEYIELLARWEFVLADFSALIPRARPGSLLYVDPPYDGTFVDYSKGGFTWEQQVQLAKLAAAHQGPVAASNSATPRILELYGDLGFQVDVFDAPRSISSDGDRSSAREIFAVKNVDVRGRSSVTVSPAATHVAEEEAEARDINIEQGEDAMAFLPEGWGQEVANAKDVFQRQRLKDGDYLFLHYGCTNEKTRRGDAVIIPHKIIEAKKVDPDIEPMAPGTMWGYFLPGYGDAAQMQLPNMKGYARGLLGITDAMVKDVQGQILLGQTIQAIGDLRQAARGMLVRGVTFRVLKKDARDKPKNEIDEDDEFLGVNWYPVPGENVMQSPGVIQRRQQLESEMASPNVAAPQAMVQVPQQYQQSPGAGYGQPQMPSMQMQPQVPVQPQMQVQPQMPPMQMQPQVPVQPQMQVQPQAPVQGGFFGANGNPASPAPASAPKPWAARGWMVHTQVPADPVRGQWWYHPQLPTGQNVKTEAELAAMSWV